MVPPPPGDHPVPMTTTLITGANKGLGRETARRLLAAGHTVWMGARDPERGRAAAEELGGRFVALDVTDDDSVAAAAATVAAGHGGLDVLVNNAGITGGRRPVAETTVRRPAARLRDQRLRPRPRAAGVPAAAGAIGRAGRRERVERHGLAHRHHRSRSPGVDHRRARLPVVQVRAEHAHHASTRRRTRGCGSTPSIPASPRPTSTSTAARRPSRTAPRRSCAWPASVRTARPGRSWTRAAASHGDHAAILSRVLPVVDAAWVATHRDEVVLADVRWYLDGRSGRAAYVGGHLPGAVFVDLDADLAAPPGPGGRHPLPEPAAFAAAMGRLGIGDADDASSRTTTGAAWSPRGSCGCCARRVTRPRCSTAGSRRGTGRWRRPSSARPSAVFTAAPWPPDRLASADDAADAARRRGARRARPRALRGHRGAGRPARGSHPGRAQRAVPRERRSRRTAPPGRGVAPPPRRCRRGRRDTRRLLLRLGRQRMPHAARARACRTRSGQALSGLVVGVERGRRSARGDGRRPAPVGAAIPNCGLRATPAKRTSGSASMATWMPLAVTLTRSWRRSRSPTAS